MNGHTSETISTELEEARPTYANLVKHVEKFGLDSEPKGYNRGKAKSYTGYKGFRSDAAVEVARARLPEGAYVMFVERFGSHAWGEEARKDWNESREDT